MTIRTLRVGVDVGGTNTDAVILDLTAGSSTPVLASHKALTTPDVSTGIANAIEGTLAKTDVDRAEIKAVAIGTTSFVNSLIERDARKLQKVALLRLCGPYSRLTPPFAAFPYELREVLEGPCFFAQGGLQVDGREISSVNPQEIRGICAELKRSGIRTVAVSAVYAPIDHTVRQEELVRDIIQHELPHVKVTISKEVANIGESSISKSSLRLGLLERENATILNAALLDFAAIAVAGFKASMKALSLSCPLFLTSNDGTLMTCERAEQFPIQTFSSGPTNSMRGAHFLASLANGRPMRETALVIDVGGTTTEIGVLLPSGFPRQAAAHHELCGVPLNFAMPHVHSIGLGGGSRVRVDDSGKVTVGPDSLGYRIDQALSFGGDTLAATDIVVAAGRAPGVGNAEFVKHVGIDTTQAAQDRMKVMLELAIDSMKTNTSDIPVYLVGGGAILAPDALKGVSEVHRFPFYDAANAVGAACAQVSGVIDTFEDVSGSSISAVQKEVEARAIAKAVAAGADPANTVIVETENIPIAYTTGRCRFYVKAAGPWTGKGEDVIEQPNGHDSIIAWNTTDIPASVSVIDRKQVTPKVDIAWTAERILSYTPTIRCREWLLSEIDLEWIATGCYILGTGGGGSPQHDFLALREMVRAGEEIRVIDLKDLAPESMTVWGGGIGSPEVSAERLMGEEYNEAIVELLEFTKTTNVGALCALEIGGGNGMINLISGSTKYLNLPVLDGDFMGRAYPTGWQTTPNVYDTGDKGSMLLPAAMSSGDGNVIFMTKAKHYKEVDAVLRAGCVEMGTHAGAALRPLTKTQLELMLIRNTISQSWRIGRAVALANKQSNIGNIGSILVDAMGGSKAAKVLFAGKIVELGRRIYKGHTYGEIVIQALAASEEEDEDPSRPRQKFEGTLKSKLVNTIELTSVPFKNENLLCEHSLHGKTEVIAGVPDLIAVLDAQNGTALGTPVLGITAAPQWTDTPRGLEMGALPAFGYDLPYTPLGQYVKPESVIDEYGSV